MVGSERRFFGVIFAVLVIGVTFGAVIYFRPMPDINPIYEEVDAIVAKKNSTQQVGAEVSAKLEHDIRSNPKRAMLCLAMSEAIRSWPHMDESIKAEILPIANKDIGFALELFKVRLKEAIGDSMKRSGYDPDQQGWHAWFCNNPSSAYLFVDWPIARSIRREQRYLLDNLKGIRPAEGKRWYEPKLTFAEYSGWSYAGIWPDKLAGN
jgi:hypothetical protein